MWNCSACKSWIILSTVRLLWFWSSLSVTLWNVEVLKMCGNVSDVSVLQEIFSGSVHSQSSGLLVCLVCCPVWIRITQKEAFHFLFYPTLGKLHCLMCQVQLIVPVGLHHQRNICCKTWHKKPETHVCIGCHILYLQFYHQWTDESWCVTPACCLHTVVPTIVCDILLWNYVCLVTVVASLCTIAVKFRLCCNCSHPFCCSTPFVHLLTDIASSLKPVWHVTAMLFTDMSCGNVGHYQLNSNIGVFVCVFELFKYEAMSVAVLEIHVTWPTLTWDFSHQMINSLFQKPCILDI